MPAVDRIIANVRIPKVGTISHGLVTVSVSPTILGKISKLRKDSMQVLRCDGMILPQCAKLLGTQYLGRLTHDHARPHQSKKFPFRINSCINQTPTCN